MSAGKIKDRIRDDVNAFSVNGKRFYTVINNAGKWMIGGVSAETDGDVYMREAEDADAIVLLTSKPEFAGSLADVIRIRPDMPVYASAAGLRNIKEIVNTGVNENLIKDGLIPTTISNLKFIATPGLSWMDSAMVLYNGVLFSGELFSGLDEEWDGFDEYYRNVLSVHAGFVRSAVDKLRNERIEMICPAFGDVISGENIKKAFERYEILAGTKEKSVPIAVILYASKYGYTRKMAEYVAKLLAQQYKIEMVNVMTEEREKAAAAVDRADILLVGTHTINRNAPSEMWDAVTSLDLINKRGMPYLVFGSYGWAGDGIKLIDSALRSMGMKAAAKPVEALFNPSETDLAKLKKAVSKFLDE